MQYYFWGGWGVSRALARILKLPVIFERVPVQNGVEWSKKGLKLYKMVENGHFLPVKMTGMTGPS